MNRVIRFFKVCWPLITISFILIIFLFHVENATFTPYTFNIQSGGNELTIISGANHIGDTVVIRDGIVYINDHQYSYTIRNKKGQVYDLDFIRPDGLSYEFNGASTSFVDFHTRWSGDFAYGGNSSRLGYKHDLNSDEDDLLISATKVHLRVLELYRSLQIYSVALVVFIILGYWLYLKPLSLYSVYCKVFNKDMGMINLTLLKIIGTSFMVLSSVFIFLLV